MSRKVKNIIMITLIVITVILSFLTMNDAKNNRLSQEKNDFGGQQFGNPPDMKNDENNNFKNDMSNPPEKPENDQNINQNDDKITPQNQEDKRQNRNPNQGQNFEQMDKLNGEKQDFRPEIQEKNNSLQTSYYILFGIEAFIISLLLVYLCMSNFNKKIVRETMGAANKIVIYIILVIILTSILTYSQGLLTKNIFIGNDKEQFQNGNIQMPDMNSNNKNLSNENKTEQF